MQTYKAVVLGGTGAVGGNVVKTLINSPKWSHITSVVRRQPTLSNEKGHQAAFCTLGAGEPSTISREELYKIDVTYATEFAKACKAGNVQYFAVMTSVGADPNSVFYMLRYKAELEQNIKDLGFEKFSTFRPSLLVTKEMRYGLRGLLSQKLIPKISWMFPSQFTEIKVEDIARSMVLDADKFFEGHSGESSSNSSPPEFEIYHWKEMTRINGNSTERKVNYRVVAFLTGVVVLIFTLVVRLGS